MEPKCKSPIFLTRGHPNFQELLLVKTFLIHQNIDSIQRLHKHSSRFTSSTIPISKKVNCRKKFYFSPYMKDTRKIIHSVGSFFFFSLKLYFNFLPKISEILRGSPTKIFGTMRQKIFDRKL